MNSNDMIHAAANAAHAVRPGADLSEASALADTLGDRDVCDRGNLVVYLLLAVRVELQREAERNAEALSLLDAAIRFVPLMLEEEGESMDAAGLVYPLVHARGVLRREPEHNAEALRLIGGLLDFLPVDIDD